MRKALSIIALVAAAAVGTMHAQTARNITLVEDIDITTPVGTVPRLPYRAWVVYDDGTSGWRQVRWNASSPAVEQALADASRNPAGSSYDVQGYITGDNATTQGQPISAHVRVVASDYAAPDRHPVAEPLPLDKVRLLGSPSGDDASALVPNRLTANRDLDIDHLLSLDVRQQLYNYRDTYGLPTEGYPEADGWDSPTTKLKGHGSGHYMSALALAYASCPDKARRRQLLERIRIMVDELRRCQERTFVFDDSLGRYREARDLAPESELRQLQGTWADFDRYKHDYSHYGYGYLNAIPAQHCVLIEMYRAYNNEQWVWAPYYSVHKQLAGLIDIADYVDDRTIAAKALLTAKDMGLWVWNRMHYRTFVDGSGTQEQRRSRPGNRYEMWNIYIAGEVGGMAESLARLSTMVADKADSARLLEAATCFDSPAFFDPLSKNIDAIRTRHANQHIPMITGALWAYRAGARPYYYNLAENFWTLIQGRYRYAMGGVGNGEMFRQPYSQILSMCTNVGTDWRDRSTYPEPTLNETCCAYNLAKLTKDLNTYHPNDARYMDYYERVLYNQIVGSLRHDDYAVLYQYAVGLNASKPWGNETPQSTCCGGTGAENHVKYQEAAYFVGGDTLWVALYLPTEAEWTAKGVTIRQTCQWPAERSRLSIASGRGRFAMKLRVPYWATEGFDIRLNGRSLQQRYQPSSYVTIPVRQWSQADSVEVVMPFCRHIDYGPDKMEVAATGPNHPATRFRPEWCGAVMRGPLVMAAQGVKTWDEATLDLRSGDTPLRRLADTMVPDYAADAGVTHYFRILLPGTPVPVVSEASETGADDSRLKEAMQVARSRRDAQQAWHAMTVKVPEYAPWAPHGYARMMQQYDAARTLYDDPDRSSSQAAIDEMTTSLLAAINTMRPGNLPELEDLDELLPLLTRAQAVTDATPALREAVEYAQMVVKYVSDGSGTADMIARATRQLREILP